MGKKKGASLFFLVFMGGYNQTEPGLTSQRYDYHLHS